MNVALRIRIGTLLVVLAAVPGVHVVAQEAPRGDAEAGRGQYMEFGCWQCHGTTGAGAGWQGPRLAPNPMPFVAFAAQVRKPRGQMPHYADPLLTDEDIVHIYAFLRSIPVGPAARDIDALKR
jgi:mono/diheme cytochrome c family protein